MRDINRIPRLLNLLGQVWQGSPDSRLTQLVDSAAHLGGWRQQDIFHCEDDATEKGLLTLLGPKPLTTPLIEKYRYIVMRRPCFEGDDDRYAVASTWSSLVDAEKWILTQQHEYHDPDTYFIVRD